MWRIVTPSFLIFRMVSSFLIFLCAWGHHPNPLVIGVRNVHAYFELIDGDFLINSYTPQEKATTATNVPD